jgi:hypothetical protein
MPDGGSSCGRAKAIRSYCLENCCCGDRSEVANCSTPTCPLFPFRRSKVDRSVELTSSKSACAF